MEPDRQALPAPPGPSRPLPALDSLFPARTLIQEPLPTPGVSLPLGSRAPLSRLRERRLGVGGQERRPARPGWGDRARGRPGRAHGEAARRLRPSGSSSPPGRAQGHPGAGGAALQKLTLQHCLMILLKNQGSDSHA